MFGFRKSKRETEEPAGWIAGLKARLGKTRGGLPGGLMDLLRGRALDDEAW